MIKYALVCPGDHEFEAWFASSDAYDTQAERGLVECPVCGSVKISKQIMVPMMRDSGGKRERPPAPAPVSRDSDSKLTPEDFERVASKVREHIAETHDYVGDGFADEARAMFYGEQDVRPVWGETTPEESKALSEEGIPAAPLPAPFAPPKPVPKDVKKLN